MKKNLMFALLASLLLAGAVGCSSSDDEVASTETAAPPATEAMPPAPAEEEPMTVARSEYDQDSVNLGASSAGRGH